MKLSVNILTVIIASFIFCYSINRIDEIYMDMDDSNNLCKIIDVNEQICYPLNGGTYLKQNVTVDKNNLTMLLECGQIRSCEHCKNRSCCPNNVRKQLYCYKDDQENYHPEYLYSVKINFYYLLIAIACCILTVKATEEKQTYIDITTQLLHE